MLGTHISHSEAGSPNDVKINSKLITHLTGYKHANPREKILPLLELGSGHGLLDVDTKAQATKEKKIKWTSLKLNTVTC